MVLLAGRRWTGADVTATVFCFGVARKMALKQGQQGLSRRWLMDGCNERGESWWRANTHEDCVSAVFVCGEETRNCGQCFDVKRGGCKTKALTNISGLAIVQLSQLVC